jgi:hypothetical protein
VAGDESGSLKMANAGISARMLPADAMCRTLGKELDKFLVNCGMTTAPAGQRAAIRIVELTLSHFITLKMFMVPAISLDCRPHAKALPIDIWTLDLCPQHSGLKT